MTALTRAPRVRTAAVVLVACMATACGSTVQQSGGGSAVDALAGQAPSGNGLGVPGVDDSGLALPGGTADRTVGPDGESGPTRSGPSGTNPGSASQPPGPASNTAGRPGAGGAPVSGMPVSNARGVTDTTITIGLEYIQGADEARSNMGFEGVSSGDQKRQLDILVEQVNKTGGFAGREVVPVFHVYEANSGNTNSANEQAACATFAEDNEVFAVLSAINHTEIFLSCLTDVGVPYISAPGLTINDDDVFRRYPLHLELNAVSLSLQGALFGKPLADTGYYDDGASIGLLTFDLPNFTRAVEQHLEPGLARIGRKVDEKVELAYPQSTSDQGALAAAVANAVLRFRQRNITHVLITDVSALTTVLFVQAASNQGYYPRYGWLSPNGGQAAADLITDKRALEGAVQLGWYPSIDLNAANQDVIPAGAKPCADLFAANGYTPSDRNEETVLQLQCEIFFFAQRAAAQSPELTGSGFVQAMQATSTTVPPASTYRIDLRTAPAGAADYRVQRWVTSCTCFRPDPGVKPLR